MAVEITVVQNSAGSGPGTIPRWVDEQGAVLNLIRADQGDGLPTGSQVELLDAVVLLGGGLMPDADATHPWLPAERELIRACVAQGVPLLGICLGGQLIAHTFGGQVQADHGTPEHGAVRLRLLDARHDDPLFGSLPDSVPGIEHHRDQITAIPPEAVLLAATDACPRQAFRVGDLAWALQWHPEAPGTRVAEWDRSEAVALGLDPDQVIADAAAHTPELEKTWSALFAAFVGLAERRRAQRVGAAPLS